MTTTPAKQAAALKRRVKAFYDHLAARRFARCYRLIDPKLLEKPTTVTLHQYELALDEFLRQIGSFLIVEPLAVEVHANEPAKLYEGRDFALGKTTWEDATGVRHVFSERWVCDGGKWFTRSTGLLKPVAAVVSATASDPSVESTRKPRPKSAKRTPAAPPATTTA